MFAAYRLSETVAMFGFYAVAAFTWLLFSVVLNVAGAQQPTQAQREAIRESCRADFIAHCSTTEPGGKDALECLMRNDAKLSVTCKAAVEAIAAIPEKPATSDTPAAATVSTSQPATTQSQEELLKTVQQTCTLNDFAAHCSWIAPTSPELLLCLKANAAALSPACQKVMGVIPAAATPVTATPPAEISRPASPSKKTANTPKPLQTSAPSSPVPALQATGPRKPNSRQLSAIRAACRSDFMTHCSGVQPGGAAALQCLRKNSTLLSASCHNAVAAIDGGAPAAAAGAPAAVAPATVAALGPIAPMRPRLALAILRICDAEQRSLCSGVEPGAGRMMSCLAENAASLSPRCYAALSAVARR